jgi:hypothetical protein
MFRDNLTQLVEPCLLVVQPRFLELDPLVLQQYLTIKFKFLIHNFRQVVVVLGVQLPMTQDARLGELMDFAQALFIRQLKRNSIVVPRVV